MRKTDIMEVTSRKLAPFMLMFGLYVVFYGHLSPGGGFQGGVVLASAMVLLFLCYDVEQIERLFPVRTFIILETCAFLVFISMGIAAMVFRGEFMAVFLPVLRAGDVPVASFVLILNIVIGLKVGAGISLVCYYLLKEDG